MKWNAIDTKVKGYGREIIFAEENFFLLHYDPNGVALSKDLINWEDFQFDSNLIGRTENIAYGNGIFIITGNAGNTNNTYIIISKDGEKWEYKKLNTGESFSMHNNTCKFINNRFVFLTGYYNYNINTGIKNYTVQQIYETRNGEVITRHDHRINGSEDLGAMDITYGNGLYVLVGESGSIFTSTDLNNWTRRKSGVSTRLVGISYGKGTFVITGADGIILTSTNGIDWTKRVSNSISYLIRSRYDNGLFVAVGYNGTVLTSINAIDWVEEDDPFINSTLYGLAYANNKFVVSSGRYSNSKTVPIMYCEITREVSYSNDESLYVFNKNLDFLGVIDSFISLRWRRKYYEAGEMELVVAPYKNNIRLLQKDNIIIRKEYSEAAIIDTKDYNDDGTNVELTVTGNFLSIITKRRIIKQPLKFSGKIIDGQKELINKSTPLTTSFEIEPTSLASDSVEFQISYKNTYANIVKLSKLGDIGFRIVPNIETKVFRFENFKGLDRTKNQIVNERYCFSKNNCNVEKIHLVDTNKNKCNYVLVGGVGEGSSRILKEVKNGNPTGFDLYESFFDAKNESNQNMTSQEYLNILETKGKELLQDETETIEFIGLSTDYKKKWDLGDVVDVDLKEINFEGQKRITEVEEIIERNSRSIYPTFGPPLAEKLSLED